MTRLEENVKLRALLEQVRTDLGPALAVLSEETTILGQDSRCAPDWFVGLAYVQCYSIDEQLNNTRLDNAIAQLRKFNQAK